MRARAFGQILLGSRRGVVDIRRGNTDVGASTMLSQTHRGRRFSSKTRAREAAARHLILGSLVLVRCSDDPLLVK